MLTADATREHEARASADSFLAAANSVVVEVYDFRDGFLPYSGAEVKEASRLRTHVEHVSRLRSPRRPKSRSSTAISGDPLHVLGYSCEASGIVCRVIRRASA